MVLPSAATAGTRIGLEFEITGDPAQPRTGSHCHVKSPLHTSRRMTSPSSCATRSSWQAIEQRQKCPQRPSLATPHCPSCLSSPWGGLSLRNVCTLVKGIGSTDSIVANGYHNWLAYCAPALADDASSLKPSLRNRLTLGIAAHLQETVVQRLPLDDQQAQDSYGVSMQEPNPRRFSA